MSAEEAVATAPAPTPPPAPPADLAAMLQQIQALQAAQAAPPAAPATSAPPNPLANLEAILSTASLANLASGGGLNPLSMLALTSSLNQSSPVYQGIARVLLTMNMGQMLATHQTSELLATMNQQETLMALLAARGAAGALPFMPGQQAQQQQSQFAVPLVPHMSLKRSKDMPVAVDRKKSCPPMVAAPAPPPPPPKSPTPPPKSMFENLPPEMKEKNEMFRKEILRRLDIILLEELGADDEEDEKKPIPSSEEDEEVKVDGEQDMGSTGSAFRRILSRSSTMGNNSNSPSASGTTTPSAGSLSSGQDSPPLEVDPLSSEMVEMLQSVALKQKESSDRVESLSKAISDETVFLQNFPCIWSGVLAIKSNVVRVKLHFVNGNAEFLKTALGRRGALQRENVKITQRLRLDNGQVEHLHCVLTDPQYACCVAFVESATPDELTSFEGVLQTSFIEYLKTKNIAGIASLAPTEVLGGARVHVFPPGELVDKYLAELAPALYNYLFEQNTKYLFIAFTDDKTPANMQKAPSALSMEPPPC